MLILVGISIGFPNANRVPLHNINVTVQILSYRLNSSSFNQLFAILLFLVWLSVKRYLSRQTISSRWQLVWANILGAVYAIAFLLGNSFSARNNLTLIWGDSANLAFSVWYGIALFFVLRTFFNLILTLLNKPIKTNQNENSGVNEKKSKYYWLKIFGLMVLIWLPTFVLYFPGVVGWDGFDQINQYFYQPTINHLHFYLTNHHPYLVTLILGFCIKIGMSLFHSFSVGVLINTILESVLMCLSLASLVTVIRNKVGYRPARYLFAFFALFPIFSFWAVTFDKTGYFIATVAFFLAAMLNLTLKPANASQHKLNFLWLGISALSVGLTRNDGFLYVFLALIGCLLMSKKNRLLFIGSLGSAVVLIIIWLKVALPLCGVLPSEPGETLAIPMQQIARVARDNPSSISKQEYKELNKIIKFQELPRAYKPDYYDSVKNQIRWPMWRFKGNYAERSKEFHRQPIVSEKNTFLKNWLSIGLKNKKLYLEAWWAESGHFIFPLNAPNYLIWNGPVTVAYERTSMTKDYKLANGKGVLEPGYNDLLNFMVTWPGISILFNAAFWGFAFLVLATSLIFKKIWGFLPVIFMGVGMFLVPFIGPVDGGLRYYFALMVIVPALFVCSLFSSQIVNDDSSEHK